jgi:DtxR family Mn-dependent transcriptional regulator
VSETESREEYLEAVFKLAATDQGATITRIAQELDVRPASASQMVTRMVETGWLRRDKSSRGQIALTKVGRSEALRLVRRHRLSERFLTDYLELPWDEVHAEACRLEHVLSDAAEASLARRLGYPATCPHGRLIPYESATAVDEPKRTLADMEPGEESIVSHISDEDPELLRYVASSGLRPGAAIKLEEAAPFDGPLTVAVGEERHPVGLGVARKVFVAPSA